MPFDLIDESGNLLEEQTVRAIILYNPLDMSDRTIADLTWSADKTLADYLDGLTEEHEWSVTVAGKIAEKQDWGKIQLKPTDTIIVGLLPNKAVGEILAVVALVVLTIYAPAISAGLVPLLGVSLTTATIITSGIIFAGGLLVTALLGALNKPNSNNSSNSAGGNTGPSYGLDGPKSTATEGIVVPLVYGEFRVAGNKINEYVENGFDPTGQELYMQFLIGEGVITNVGSLWINGIDAYNYPGFNLEWTNGAHSQPPLNWFVDTVTPYSVQSRLTQTPTSYTTSQPVDRLRIDFEMPNGLYSYDQTTGKMNPATINLVGLIRPTGTTTWNPFNTGNGWQQLDPGPGNTYIAVSGIRITVLVEGQDGEENSPYSTLCQIIPAGGAIAGSNFSSNANVDDKGQGGGSVLSTTDWTTIGSDSGVVPNKLYVAADGTAQWTAGTILKVYEADNLQDISYSFNVTGCTIVAVEGFTAQSLSFTNVNRETLRVSVSSGILPNGQYDIQFYRTTAESTFDYLTDEIVLTDVNEILSANPVDYINTATYGVHVTLGSNLTSEPSCSVLVTGLQMPIYDRNGNVNETTYSQNPADIALDLLLNPRNHYAFTTNRIDFISFDNWRTYCAENSLLFNGIFDTATNVWDALLVVMRVGRASPIMQGTKWAVLVEAPADPVMMFTQDNMVKGTFQSQWTGRVNRANMIECQYYEKEDGSKQHSVFVFDETYVVERDDPVVQSTVQLIGVNNSEQASNEANLLLNMQRYLVQSTQFDVFLQAMGCVVGDVILVQHDMPQWGFSAMITAVNGSNIDIDSDVPGEDEGDWRMLLVRSVSMFGSSTVIDASGDQIILGSLTSPVTVAQDAAIIALAAQNGETLNINGSLVDAFDTFTNHTDRVMIDGVDFNVVDSTFIGATNQLVISTDSTGVGSVGIGHTAQHFRIDTLCEATLAPFTNTRSLNITGWLTDAGNPQPGDRIMLGRVNQYKKPFRVLKIDYKDDHTRTINAIEYNESVYGANAMPTPNYSSLTLLPYQVISLSAKQDTVISATGGISYLAECDWYRTLNDPRGYNGAYVYKSDNYGNFYLAYNATNPIQAASFPANIGDTIRFKVVAYDRDNIAADFSSAPIAAVTIHSPNDKPVGIDPSSVVCTGGVRLISLSWGQPSDPYVAYTEVWENVSSDQSGSYKVFQGNTNSFVRNGLDPNTQLFYWLRTVSTSAVNGDFIGPFNATTLLLITSDLADEIINTAKFAQTIKAPILITDLSTPGIDGQLYFNESDLRLYRYTNAAGYTLLNSGAIVFEADSITAGMIAVGAVGADEIAAGAIHAVHLAADFVLANNAQFGNAVIENAQIAHLAVGTDSIQTQSITQTSQAFSTTSTDALVLNTWTNWISTSVSVGEYEKVLIFYKGLVNVPSIPVPGGTYGGAGGEGDGGGDGM
jgi:predicted phage tail protein